MPQTDMTPPFEQAISFLDVDQATLAREDATFNPRRALLSGGGAWQEFARRVLLTVQRKQTA